MNSSCSLNFDYTADEMPQLRLQRYSQMVSELRSCASIQHSLLFLSLEHGGDRSLQGAHLQMLPVHRHTEKKKTKLRGNCVTFKKILNYFRDEETGDAGSEVVNLSHVQLSSIQLNSVVSRRFWQNPERPQAHLDRRKLPLGKDPALKGTACWYPAG